MAQTESKIKLIFEGVERGVAAAAAKSSAAIRSLDDDNSKLSKSADRAQSALGVMVGSMFKLGTAGSAIQVVGGITGALTQLAPAALLVPGAMLAGAAAMVTFKIATAGVGDALEAGLSGDMKKFAEATKDMAPAMKEAVGAVVAFKPQIDNLKRTVQGEFWDSFAGKIKTIGASYLPMLTEGLASVARSLGGVAYGALKAVDTPLFKASVAGILDHTAGALDGMASSAGDVLTGFVRLGAAGATYLPRLGTWIGGLTKQFSDWAVKVVQSGKFFTWVDGAIQGFKDLGGIIGNIGSIIGSVFSGLGGKISSPLAALRDLTGQVADFLKTAQAQEGLQRLGDALQRIGAVVGQVTLTALKQLGIALVAAAPAAATIAETLGHLLVDALNILGPAISAVAYVLGEFPGVTSLATVAVVGFVAAIKTIKAVNAVTELLGMESVFTRVGTSAETAGGKVGVFGGKLGALKGAGGAAGVAVAIGAIAFAIDDLNVKAAGSADKLDGIAVNLHQFRESIGGILSGDFGFGQMVDQAKAAAMGIMNALSGLKLTPIKLDVDPTAAKAETDKLISEINGAAPVVNINGNSVGAGFALREILGEIAAGKESVTIDGKPVPAQEALARVKSLIDTSVGNVTIDGKTVPASRALDMILARTNSSSASIQVGANTGGAQGVVDSFIRRNDGRVIHIYTSVLGAGGIASAGRLAAGGPVQGPGSGTSDTAGLFALSNGEYVATARQVQNAGGTAAFGRMMDALDRGPAHMAGGGSVMRASAKAAMRTPSASSSGSSGAVQVSFAGNTSDALATVIMSMVRTGKIQLKAA